MTRIIDNSKEKLASVLNREFSDADEIAIASAYFNVHGYGAIKDGLGDRPLRLLLGREPTESIKWEEEVLKELEEEEDDLRYFTLLRQAIEYFEDPKREVRTIIGPFFHGKAYIAARPSLQEVRNGVGTVGSSNFTLGGLVRNRELNMLNSDREVVQELADWFLDAWKESRDFKTEFLSFLKNYVTTRSPYEVVAKALYETYKSNLDVSVDAQKVLRTLYPHQMLSVRNALFTLEKYGGVLIADATGLGKTRVALSLALNAIREGKKTLLIAPKSVLDTTWQDEMRETKIHIDSVSSEKLSQDPDSVLAQYQDKDFIIVDEAHYFRTPSTIRYSALRELLLKNNAQVILATATPVNNSLMDLYFLFSLYLKEDCISDLYNMTLKGYFTANQKKWIQGEPIDMEEVLQRFMVRHSRHLAQALDKEGKIRFPRRVLDDDPRDRYSTDIDYQRIDEILGAMNFVFYDLSVDRLGERLKLPDGTPVSSAVEESRRETLKGLIKTVVIVNIFKRLESSVEAFTETLESLDEYMTNAIRYAQEQGYFVPPSLKGDLIFSSEEELPTPDELFYKPGFAAAKQRCRLTPKEVEDFVAKCKKDQEAIKRLLAVLPSGDAKYETFGLRMKDILKGLDPSSANGVIVFSQYAATARYLYDKLRKNFLSLPVRLVTGEESRDEYDRKVDKTEVIRAFQKSGGILVSTDVLSEGQNLQNAQYVVNYDFPWNPVVLIQRVGRVDRMGSIHPEVYLVNMLPKNGDPDDPESLEYFLELMKKLYMRLEAIRQTVGLDASTLGEEAAPKDFGVQEALARGDSTVLESLARELEQFTTDPMDALARIMDEKGLDWLKSLPAGIGAYKEGTRDSLFILFTDGKEHYWRMKYFDGGKETVTSTNEIVNLLLVGDTSNKGQMIQYASLIDRMREMKGELAAELERRRQRSATLEGTPAKPSKVVREIFDELARSGAEGEELAAAFREMANRSALVRELQEARKNGELFKRARELLKNEKGRGLAAGPQVGAEPLKLRRVCWCWVQPTPNQTLSDASLAPLLPLRRPSSARTP
jgi:SNF2 family DNA or RNA helicase